MRGLPIGECEKVFDGFPKMGRMGFGEENRGVSGESSSVITRFLRHRAYLREQEKAREMRLLWWKEQIANQPNAAPFAVWDAWWQQQTDRGSSLHPTLEWRGRPDPVWLVLGKNSVLERDVTVWIAPEAEAEPTIGLGERVYIGRNTYLGAYLPVTIGANSIIGAYSYLISGNHRYERRDVPIRDQGFTGAAIVLEEDVWLGTHVVVLPGVRIGRGAIIAAGSIVNKNIPEYQIWGGTPARFLKERPGV